MSLFSKPLPMSLAYGYARFFTARFRGAVSTPREVYLFTVPISDALVWRDFLGFIREVVPDDICDNLARQSVYSLSSGGWVFAILDGNSARFFGVSSILSSIRFFTSFYKQFKGLDSFGFYDSYNPAGLVCS